MKDPRWIKITKRLPCRKDASEWDFYLPVWVWHNGEVVFGEYDPAHNIWWDIDDKPLNVKNITHWMPATTDRLTIGEP